MDSFLDRQYENHVKHQELTKKLFLYETTVRYAKALIKNYYTKFGEQGLLELRDAIWYHLSGMKGLNPLRGKIIKLIEQRIALETKWYHNAEWKRFILGLVLGLATGIISGYIIYMITHMGIPFK